MSRRDGQYFVYLMSNASRTLYTGVTNDIIRRVWEHKNKVTEGFTSQYHVTQLVHFEAFPSPRDAIAREKQIKGWRRSRKIALVSEANPEWRDLSEEEGFFSPVR